MQSNWETTKAGVTHYVDVSPTHITVGEHRGSAHSDCAGACTHAEFLSGRWHAEIKAAHGPAAFAAIIAAVHASVPPPDPLYPQIQAIPLDPALPALLADPQTTHGRNFYGNAGRYNTAIPSTTVTCHFNSNFGHIQSGPNRLPFNLFGHGSSVTAWQDLFCIVVNDTVVTVDASATLITFPHLPFGTDLRVNECSRHPETWILSCFWFRRLHPDCLFRFHPVHGLTGRWEQPVG